MFTVLKYVDIVLGYDIMDLKHVLRGYMQTHMDQFDHRMELVWHCGQRLGHLSTSYKTQIDRMRVDLMPKISIDASAMGTMSIIQDCPDGMAMSRGKLGVTMTNFFNQKV